MIRVLGLGDNVVDFYVNKGEMFPGGNALNVAAHAALLGCRASYLGCLGNDDYQKVILRGLESAGVDYSLCPVMEDGCTKVCRYEIIDGERRFLETDTGQKWAGPLSLTPELIRAMEKYDLIHSCANAKMENERHKLKGLKAVLTYDFTEKEKYRTREYLEKICPGLDLAMFSLCEMGNQEIEAFAGQVRRLGTGHVLVTAGERGQYFSGPEYSLWNPASLVKAKDTMGAGDAFIACLGVTMCQAGWKKGKTLPKEAVRQGLALASTYASENCMKEGGFTGQAERKNK